MDTTPRVPVAIIGSGDLGTDLMIKLLRTGRDLRMAARVGVDPQSEGSTRANRRATAAQGVDGFLACQHSKTFERSSVHLLRR